MRNKNCCCCYFYLSKIRYPGYYEQHAPYDRSRTYWVILAARLIFVIVFQMFVFTVTQVIAYIIPDIPEG